MHDVIAIFQRRSMLTAAPLTLTVLLAGCALFGPRPVVVPQPSAPAVEAAPPAVALPAPVDTHEFELSNAEDGVVGEVQITTASQQDTLPDIARRFNVGYEEIVRANPGVDPWLPGEGRLVVLPTRFVLPNAPHEGI